MLGKFILWLSALVFIGYGLLGIANPALPAGFAGPNHAGIKGGKNLGVDHQRFMQAGPALHRIMDFD